MFLKLIGNLINSNNRELKKLREKTEKINFLSKKIKKLKKKDFAKQTQKFKDRLKKGESLDDLLIDAFALAREASDRTIYLRPYDEQLMAGISFHEGKVIEQKTGEGKTLSAVPALYLNALIEKGCHLVTVNDYLAKRDAGWNGPIFELLGISVAAIVHDKAFLYDSKTINESVDDPRLKHLKEVSRKEAYNADITYGTNNEFGFDYLRDNMVQQLSQKVQRGHNFAIIDEVDSILIDEARTPLIISAPDTEPTDKYYKFANLVNSLSKATDYEIDEKHKTVSLTEHGIKKIEKKLGIDNLYEKDFDTIHHLEQALKSREHFHKDKDYVIKDGEIIIVDEFTGRLMFGRRYSEGLHQAIEAKENVTIRQESKTLATISFQNYFRMYKKLSGMTGTAETEAGEFKKIYNLETLIIPTHKPMIRIDHPDSVYKTERAKYSAIVQKVEKLYKKGQPILIGTPSIEKNQIIDKFLSRKKIPHQVLNAKNHKKEASIIAEAGRLKSVTVATNMAGRGVDIVLGGDFNKRDKKKWKKEHDKVIELGGLHVIGIEKHESRRIDNQLRGRSGRQGDAGTSRFYVSLEDEIMRIFGGEQIAKLMTTLKMPENVPLEHPMVTKAIEQAQMKVESFHFDARKHLVEYDDVMNKQREIIYRKRDQILLWSDNKKNYHKLRKKVYKLLEDEISHIVNLQTNPDTKVVNVEDLINELIVMVPFNSSSQIQIENKLKKEVVSEKVNKTLWEIIRKTYEERESKFKVIIREIEKFVLISTIDKLWIEHLDSLDDLREGVGLRGYAQRDPLVEYKNEAFTMFEKLMGNIDYEVSRKLFRIQIAQAPQQTEIPEAEELHPNPNQPGIKTSTTPQPQTSKTKKKIGRNDPCPCGSGKKYKKCCYPKFE